MVEALDHAEAVLAGPHKARDVVRVYGERRQDIGGLVGDALFDFRCQRPHLAAGKLPVAIGFSRTPDDALAHDIAVRLVVIGTGSGAQPVSLVVAFQGSPVCLAFRHKSDAGLASGAIELTERISVGAFVRNSTEGGRNVAAGGLGTVNSFTRGEAARSQGDSLVVQSRWVIDRLLDVGCLIGNCGSQRSLVALQIGDGCLQG